MWFLRKPHHKPCPKPKCFISSHFSASWTVHGDRLRDGPILAGSLWSMSLWFVQVFVRKSPQPEAPGASVNCPGLSWAACHGGCQTATLPMLPSPEAAGPGQGLPTTEGITPWASPPWQVITDLQTPPKPRGGNFCPPSAEQAVAACNLSCQHIATALIPRGALAGTGEQYLV